MSGCEIVASTGSTRGISSDGPFYAGARSERRDFDDGANAFWSLYGKEALGHDKSRFQSLATDMEGLLLFVCSVTLFVVDLRSFMYISTGWLAFCGDRPFPRPGH
jgi:hypothetical protein